MQDLKTKADFARIAGVNGSTVSRVVKTVIKAAVVGKMIDANHPDALAYVEKKHAPEPVEAAEGIDPMYEAALAACRESGRWSARGIRSSCSISMKRAGDIMNMLKLAGVVPVKDAPPPKPKHNPKNNPGKESNKSKALKTAAVRLLPPEPTPTPVPPVETVVMTPKDDGFELPENISAFADLTIRQVIMKFGTDAAFVTYLKALKEIEAVHKTRLANSKTEGDLIARRIVEDGIITPIDVAFRKMMTDGAKTIAVRALAMVASGTDAQELEDLIADQLGSFIKPTKAKLTRVIENA